jgi:arabinofuranosyltransferase
VDRHTKRFVVVAGTLVFLLIVVRTAWVNDDAYITFRTIDNFLNGYGLRWNIANRVQAYTHPLWMFVMTGAAAISGEFFYTTIVLSAALSAATVALVAGRIAASVPMAVLALSALTLSKAFVDYSTSGLENPLTHLVLAVFFLVEGTARPLEETVIDRRRLFRLALLAALLMLNRLDTGLLVLPALVAAAASYGWRRSWRPILVGMLPLAAWEAFSLLYYGFPFPNTAYSKLKTGISRSELVYQGCLYLLDSMNNDPITLLVCVAAILSPLVLARGWAAPAGIVLYVTYVVWVGGDFMSGRFLAAPFLCAVIHLARQPVREFGLGWRLAMAAVWLTGLAAPRPTIVSNAAFGGDVTPAETIAPTGITDERRHYYQTCGLLTARRGAPMPNHKWVHMGRELAANGTRFFSTDAAGFIGWAGGPGVHFTDKYGLGDPLLARLPAVVPWRIGHFVRRVPDGYQETLETGRNQIRDPGVSAYYEKLRVITVEPIWSFERMKTILGMNLGRYERFLEHLRVRTADARR